MEKHENIENNEELDVLKVFLKHTSQGKYAVIERESLAYTRIQEETILIPQDYYYGFSS